MLPRGVPRLRSTPAVLVVSVAVVAMLAAGGWLSYRQYALTRDALNAQPAGLDAWDIAQLQRELLSFRASLALAAERQPHQNKDDLRLHWDLVWSRLEVVAHGKTHQALRALFVHNNRFPAIERILHTIDARMPRVLAEPRQALPQVDPLLRKAIAYSQEMYAFGDNAMLVRLDETRASLEAIQIQSSAIALMMVLLVALLIGIVRRTHQSRLREVTRLLGDLRSGEAKLRHLMESSIQGIVVHRGGRAVFANRTFVELHGYQHEEEIYALASVFDLFAEADRGEARRCAQEALGGHKPSSGRELQCVKQDGAPFWGEVVSRRIDWEGEPAVLTSLLDITERKTLEDQLRRSQRLEALGSLVGGIAHDFNNLIQVVSGHVRLVLEDLEDPHAGREDLHKVLSATDRATRLVSQLLAFSGRQVLHPEPVAVNGRIEELVHMLRRVIGTHIEIVTDLSPAIGTVIADPSMLDQVVMNLCLNARDAMPDGGRLTLRTEPAAGLEAMTAQPGESAASWVRIAVADTGVGIPPEIQERIFDPFFTTKDSGKGSGLGLATVHGIIRQHHGAVTVRSAAGEGTEFAVYLPTAQAGETLDRAQAEAPLLAGHGTVLVAEDAPHVQELTARFLERAGYQVLTASDGEEAMAVFDAHSDAIDLVLLDVIMPKHNGRAVYEHILSAKPGLPVLFTSGYSADVLGEEFLAQENMRLIRKPFEPKELLFEVHRVLHSPALESLSE